jgi:hypothetical protein
MKIRVQSWFIVLALFAGIHQASAQGTAFTYQGRLYSGTNPAAGSYDLRFGLYDAPTAGNQQGALLTNSAVDVSNGLFTVTLDFGDQLPGANRWLEIGARTNGSGAFTTLAPRQAITPTPYAIYAANAGDAATAGTATSATSATTATSFSGSLAGDVTGTQAATVVGKVAGQTAANVASGTSAANAATSLNTPNTIVKRDASGNFASGTITATNFAGNGGGLTNLNASQLTSGTVADARLSTNVALLNINQTFIGSNIFSGVVIVTNVNNMFKGTLTGNGAGVTNLNLSINSDGAIQPLGGFALSSSPGVGNGPQSVVTADVNGDGLPDLISANSDGTLTVLTNNGSGSFVLSATYTVGNDAQAVIAADVNNDGKLDLICANPNGDTLTVLTNDGSGNFVAASTNNVGSSPYSVTAADVNGDGKMDLISANFGIGTGNTLTVLTNKGGGVFVLMSSPVVGSGVISVTTADVNGDGKPDLICANKNSGTLTVLTNNGIGGFVVASSPVVGGGPIAVIAADVNGDGKPDLICANSGMFGLGNSLTVLTNNGSGGFVLASTPTVGNGVVSVVAADVNNDGKLDLISANASDNTLTVLLNSGGGNFVYSSSPIVGNDPRCVAAADFNGDGKVDLVSANFSDDTLSVLLNSAAFTGTFTGNGSGLTGVDAGQLTGTLPSAQLNGTYQGIVTFNNSENNFSGSFGGSFSGDGSGLINLNATQLTSGTVNDSLLSANVALRAGGNNFSGNQIVSGTLSIGMGTVFTNVQDGIFTAGTNTAGVKVVTNAFPVAFGSVPTVMATPVAQAGTDLPDVYGLTVRRVTTTNFVVNIVRVDTNGAAWTQSLRVSYHAWQ